MEPSNSLHVTEKEEYFGGLGNSKHTSKKCHSDGGRLSENIVKSNIFMVKKKDSGNRLMKNLKKLN